MRKKITITYYSDEDGGLREMKLVFLVYLNPGYIKSRVHLHIQPLRPAMASISEITP